METNFLEVSPGNKSNSRRIAWVVVIAALIMAQEVLLLGYFATEKVSMILLSSAVVSTFCGIAGPALLFAFGQKGTENKNRTNENT